MLTSSHVMHVHAPGRYPEKGEFHIQRCTIGTLGSFPCALTVLQLVNGFRYVQGVRLRHFYMGEDGTGILTSPRYLSGRAG